ncbi:MAG: DUF4931 domain-containing protein [Desulfobacterota bacterium]|nr:DUF4931 domain-containing protein [Thermodesulfobacteriota bacterium]MDW8002450.1 DUF4931 domain-containing protein [Deltaproteobacteria bacterium]
MTEIRKDPVSGDWVIVGHKYIPILNRELCPFCPGNEHLTPDTIREVKDEFGNWKIRCFPSKDFLFIAEVEEMRRAEGMYDKMSNPGAHEIVVETPEHTKVFSRFTKDETELLLRFYQERILDLKKDKRFKYIQIFKNHGELTGSRIFHAHSHILATPIIPKRIENEIQNAKAHYERKERCLFCDIIRQELKDRRRLVTENGRFAAFCPFASRFTFEVWILPKIHEVNFENTDRGENLSLLAEILMDVMKRIERLTNAYTIVYHTSPNEKGYGLDFEKSIPISEYFHWHVEIMPRDYRTARYKREDEFYVTTLTPEEGANILRNQRV